MERIETMEQFWMQGETVEDGFLFAMFTDEIVWESWPLEPERRESLRQRERNLLDIRIFNSAKELRMFRGDVGRDFRGRLAEDTEAALEEQDYFDEEQYLDIDGKVQKSCLGRTIWCRPQEEGGTACLCRGSRTRRYGYAIIWDTMRRAARPM